MQKTRTLIFKALKSKVLYFPLIILSAISSAIFDDIQNNVVFSQINKTFDFAVSLYVISYAVVYKFGDGRIAADME
jgi:hypothetical protein